MGAETATINLYINNEQAKGKLAEMETAYLDLKKARIDADKAGDTKKSLELQAQEYSSLQMLRDARRGILDIEKAMVNLSTINIRQLNTVKRTLTTQLKELNQGTDEYKTKLEQLRKVEDQLATTRSRSNKDQLATTRSRSNKDQIGVMGTLKSAWSNVMPVIGLAGVVSGGIALLKSGVSQIWSLTKTIQGDSKRALTVFGDQLGYVELQASRLSKQMGVTDRQFVSMTTNVADLLVPLDFSREKAAGMAIEVQKLSGALNEWTSGRLGVEAVSNILTKAMLGETEGLKQLGIAIRMDSEEYKDMVKQKEREGAATTAQAQSLAILELLYKKSADAQTAYNSSGNELLRFQNSASRGWREMMESMAEWFALSKPERVEQLVRTFEALNAEFDLNEKALDRLIPVYSDLSNKTNLNEIEQQQLRDAIDGIIQIIPHAAAGFDEYGKVIGLNLDAVHAFRESQRLLKLEMQEDVVEDVEDSIKSLGVEIRNVEKERSYLFRKLYEDKNIYKPFHLDSSEIDALNQKIMESNNLEMSLYDTIAQRVVMLKVVGFSQDEINNKINNEYYLTGLQIANVDKAIKRYEALAKSKADALDAGKNKPIDSLLDQKRAEITEAEKMSEKTEAEIAAKNKKLAALNVELKRLQELGVSTPPKNNGWTLETDKQFNEQRMGLMRKQLAGEYSTEEEYSRDLLALEIATLESRIAARRENGDDMAKLEKQLLEKKISQKKEADKRIEALVKTVQGGDTELEKVEREYAARLREQGLFGKKSEEMSELEKQAKLQIDREYSEKRSKINLSMLNKGVEDERKRIDAKLSEMKLGQAEELAAADTLEKKKALLKKWFSQEELRLVDTTKEADRLLKAKYAEQNEAATKEELQTILTYYQALADELTTTGSLFAGAVELTDEDSAKLLDIVNKLKSEIAKLRQDPVATPNKKSDVDVLGMSVDDWSTLFANTEGGLTALGKMEHAAKAIGEAFSDVSKLMDEIEKRDLKKYEASQNKRKKVLDQQLARGAISQENYNSRVQAIDEQTEAKRIEMERKQAIRQKEMAVFSALISTAVAIVSALEAGPIAGPIFAGIIGALGAIQIAAIIAQPLPGLERGGMLVERTQDGRRYNAEFDPKRRGLVDRPTVIVGENGSEYVVPNEGYENPTIRPVLDILERSRLQGGLRTINLTAEMQRTMMPGRSGGGYVTSDVQHNGSIKEPLIFDSDGELVRYLDENLYALKLLVDVLSKPLSAEVSMTGRKGIAFNLNEYNKLKSKTTIGNTRDA